MLVKVIILVASLVLVAQAFDEYEYKIAFADWMHAHQRGYTSDEFQSRYATFKSNMDFVERWNADPTHTHTVELNKYADMSIEEFSNIHFKSRVDATVRLEEDQHMVFEANHTARADIINWVIKGAVTPPMNEGQCGSCWAFSTTGAIEGISFIKSGKLIGLSTQNLVDCAQPFGPEGCDGGFMDDAFKYVISKHGLNTESQYPYVGRDETCKFNAAKVVSPISSFTDVKPAGNEDALVASISKQPVSVAYDSAHSSFQFYKSGIYYEPACSSTAVCHAGVAVGYGANYYLVKDSFGTDWGEGGYIQMSRNRNNNCGIASIASYPNV